MTQFVHLTDSKMVSRIARAGILAKKIRHGTETGFFCTPVSRSFYRTHQWLRELKRRGIRSMHAVQFNLAPKTLVRIGRFGQEHIEVPASEAARIFHEHAHGLGLEVIVPQSVPATSIKKIYLPSQVLGWRVYPEAKGRKPCGCEYCNRGQINAYRVPKPNFE